jgi:RecJ-like exonuclease
MGGWPKDSIREDSDGNKMSIYNNKIMLKLKNKTPRDTVRLLFSMVETKNFTIYFKIYNPYIHNFKKFNAVGLNYEAVRLMRDNDVIALRHYQNGDTKYVRVSEAKTQGKFLHFKTQGLEKQIFVPLKFFKKEIEEAKNKSQSEQEDTQRPLEVSNL